MSKMPLRVARIMPKCYLENGKSYQKKLNLWWSGRTKGFHRTIKKFQGCHFFQGCQNYAKNAISRTVRAIKKIQLCGGPVGQRDSKEQEKSISGLPGLPLKKSHF